MTASRLLVALLGTGILAATGFLASGGVARAADLYVNGVRADGLTSFEFVDVAVRIDNKGNVWIDAPTYRVEVDGETVAAPELSEPVPVARYWLVTEDNGSKGLTIDVVVNGRAVRKLQSGDAQAILDVGEYLQRGTNTVIINTVQSRNAGGGVFYVYAVSYTHLTLPTKRIV